MRPEANSKGLAPAIEQVTEGILPKPPLVEDDVDFYDIKERAVWLAPDLLIGNSKGYSLAKDSGNPTDQSGLPHS